MQDEVPGTGFSLLTETPKQTGTRMEPWFPSHRIPGREGQWSLRNGKEMT